MNRADFNKQLEREPRFILALIAAVYGMWLVHNQAQTDFGMVLFGARTLIAGGDPYTAIGPHGAYHYPHAFIYPATALVALTPFTLLPTDVATLLWVGGCSALLAYGITRKHWYLLPMFASESFLNNARLGQWSLLFTAMFFFPSVAIFSAVKPQAALPMLVASPHHRRTITYAVGGALTLLLVSFMLMPDWPRHWLANVRSTQYLVAPIVRPAGMVLAVLMVSRWRRWETWLILALACVPQTEAWYGVLPLFLIPATLLESALLAVVSTVGHFVGALLLPMSLPPTAFLDYLGNVLILTMYLPAAIFVFLRPNRYERPAT